MQLKPIATIAILLVVAVLVSISGCISSNNTATATPTTVASTVPTAKPTVEPTATLTVKPTATLTVKPTATPTLVPINQILVAQPASSSGPDRTAEINKNMKPETYHRVTIDGHDAYAETEGVVNDYVFPCNSWSEAQTLHATLVAKFQANGFTVRSTESPVETWGGGNSILTGLWRGSTEVVISAADSATVKPYTNILDSGSEVGVLIDLHK
jgi:hypothetical protein